MAASGLVDLVVRQHGSVSKITSKVPSKSHAWQLPQAISTDWASDTFALNRENQPLGNLPRFRCYPSRLRHTLEAR